MKISDINWGNDSAENDPDLLEYFVTSDAFGRLVKKSKNFVVGRKGSGKSALRKKLEKVLEQEKDSFVINLSPKYNSIRSILNDDNIKTRFGEEIFFQHTWLRQILLDCLCKVGDASKGSYADESTEFARKISLELNRTSKDFLENISDVLTKIKGKVGNLGEFGIQVEKELRNIADVDSLEHHAIKLAESGAKFVVLIDDLDLGWDNSRIANNMLLGLLTTVNYLSGKSHNFYICVFLREDVYSILVTKTQHADKYRDIERIRWDQESLINILSQRINYNRARNGAEKSAEPFSTVFPETIGTSNTDNWLAEHTLGRPRELIQLARYYTESVESETPDSGALKASEASYSSWKLDDLCAEYINQYPGLNSIFAFWKTEFFRQKYHLKRKEIEDMLLKILVNVPIDSAWFNNIVRDTNTTGLLTVLYEIGFIGDFVLGGEGGSRTIYSDDERHSPRFEEIQIHPCFRRAVNTVQRITKSSTEAAPAT